MTVQTWISFSNASSALNMRCVKPELLHCYVPTMFSPHRKLEPKAPNECRSQNRAVELPMLSPAQPKQRDCQLSNVLRLFRSQSQGHCLQMKKSGACGEQSKVVRSLQEPRESASPQICQSPQVCECVAESAKVWQEGSLLRTCDKNHPLFFRNHF